MELYQVFFIGLIVVAIVIIDHRRNGSFKEYIKRKRGK